LDKNDIQLPTLGSQHQNLVN